MKASEAQVLIDGFQQLVGKLVDPAEGEKQQRQVVANGIGSRLVRPGVAAKEDMAPAKPAASSKLAIIDEWKHDRALEDFEWLYQKIKARFIDDMQIDPILVKLATSAPQIEITIEPRIVQMDGSSLKGRIARLIAAGFFASAKTQSATRTELRRTGSDVNSGNLSTAFNDFVKDGFLTREGDSYVKAASLRVTEKELVAV